MFAGVWEETTTTIGATRHLGRRASSAVPEFDAALATARRVEPRDERVHGR